MTGDIELLAPAGEFKTALAAFAAGADAVYLGLNAFSARAGAVNFSDEDLANIVAVARKDGKKVYVTFNTLLTDAELAAAVERLATLEAIGPDALIVQDLGVARLVRQYFPGLALHASTQLVAHNLEGVLALRERGFSRVVLARELSLADIRSIARRCGCELEVFVHGALCYSVSGLCLFSALEKQRSGNRGRCAYCCRIRYDDATGASGFPFSMKDLRLDDRLDALREAGVASLKIEGRMKNALYVSAVVKHYRDLLDAAPESVSRADLETVFSRKTTRLYADGYGATDVVDPVNLGNLGTEIGVVKRITRDREGVKWLRFHTSRALEKYDGIQVAVAGKGRPAGFSIGDMRVALSRHNVFDVPAGSDVELRVPDDFEVETGATIFCGSSGAVKRRFPEVTWRPSDYPGGTRLDVTVTLAADGVTATDGTVTARRAAALEPANAPEKTGDAIRRAFGKLGGTGFALGACTVCDPDGLFAPAHLLNDLRRDFVASVTADRAQRRETRVADVRRALSGTLGERIPATAVRRVVKVRPDQTVPPGEWDEVVLTLEEGTDVAVVEAWRPAVAAPLRLALPVFTLEADFNALRNRVKALLRAGCDRWEAADLAGLRLLRQLGVTDVTADWSLYAFNGVARAEWRAAGVTRQVRSPEAPVCGGCAAAGDVAGDAAAGDVEWLERQSTPLFISLTRPETPDPSQLTGWSGDAVTAFRRGRLWVTTRPQPRAFDAPPGVSRRIDLSWDPPVRGVSPNGDR